ncbi:conserved hypothetical protein [Phenylobacterium zucineum HLK1]|uniref:DUF3574 domain-containing protein n=1 Tax=Phenylobacterium zucineum (strain HLK1) TaxID=450851 RepID=B4R929_PHEZH|nr:DUF3574 domain-containing protein [Phenylobacterium zucineum]ACG77699.1 conserved hypothetical protein [Phenylobacterium zucineum HLK1]
MRTAGVLLALGLGLAGCATAPPPACPPGQEHLRTAQLFLGGGRQGRALSQDEMAAFVEQEITPRFASGVTVLEGGRQWRGPENQLIREAQKVVLIVLPANGAPKRLEAVREAYKTRFQRDSVVVVTQAACVAS